jgi:hypothetical protein
MERDGVDRRPGFQQPVRKPIRTSRFAYLGRSKPGEKLLLIYSPTLAAAFITLALLYGFDTYFFDAYYSSTSWKLVCQIARAFDL